jgi:hypothetical protein
MLNRILDEIDKIVSQQKDDDILMHTIYLLRNQPSGHLDSYLHYMECRRKGTTRKLAEMLAEGKPPKSNTDVEFLRGHCNGSQFEGGPIANNMGDFYRSSAEEAGQSTTGKIYLSGLAAFAGDPRAWVSDRGEAKKVLEERGWSSDGLVENKSTKTDPM